MIRAKHITIEEFRGIRSLSIDFNEKNYAVCGPNGTGKSGIVDALEFALTGNISRLSGKGMGNVTVKDHAPHVDSRNRPDKARVILTVSIPHLNVDVKIERSIKNISTPVITPSTPEILAILEQVAIHPEFVLSRRELIKYVLSAPNDRAKAVQTLLRLDDVENTRALLLKISNAKQKELPLLQREKQQAQELLLSALQITQLSKEKILEEVNKRRAILSLPLLSELTATTSFKDGVATASATQKAIIPKTQALTDLKQLRETIEQILDANTKTQLESIIAELEVLNSDPAVVNSVSKEQFLQSSLALIEDNSCPLCDKPWDIQELKVLINSKLKKFEDTAKMRSALEKKLEVIQGMLEVFSTKLADASRYGLLLTPPLNVDLIKNLKVTVDLKRKQLKAFTPLQETINVLNDVQNLPTETINRINEIEASITVIPEANEQDSARDYLTIAQERIETWRRVSMNLKKTEDQSVLAKTVHDTYASVSTSELENIYKLVEKDFSELYREVNNDDESGFTAQLIPASGKLSFDVDFFGRGYFPPGAYHSEGHQDGMGICLYLALMRHLLGSSFMFAVLDDVLMSVDAGHRREVCNMLKKQFPNTQFIFTTHDEIWLKHLKNAGLISRTAAIQFRTWDVDHGPTKWDDRDVWQQIKDEVAKNDIRSASGLLRHYLEHISAELCHYLGASVKFRGDARFELGDLLPAAIARLKKLLKEGKATAQSWGKETELAAITEQERVFNDLVEKSNVEQWMINASIHYNEWENLQPADFKPVADAFEKLINAFVCANPTCGSVLYVIPERGDSQELRCSCKSISINLVKKKSNN
jgi:DNA repair exonuclease SbcCD ATPase subunit